LSDTNDQPSGDAGLLDSATAESPDKPAETSKAEIDHRPSSPGLETPGSPKEKPEYLPDNFWDAEKGEANYEAMAKSWGDLRKMVSQGKHKAPEGGKYDTSALRNPDLEKDPLAKGYVSWAAKWGISQAAFDEMATQFNEIAESMMPAPIDPGAELKQLGPNGQAVVNGMVDWARGLVSKGVWSKDDFEEFKIMGGTASGLRALMKVREAYEGRVPIETAPMEGAPSKEELYQMVGDPKYKTDPAFRQKVERLFQQYAN
jgi:hypothetical protein